MSGFMERMSVSVEDLYEYSKSMMFDYFENRDEDMLKRAERLAKKIIEIENNERAYNNYLFVLANSGQFTKAFHICEKLLNTKEYRRFALINLSDSVFVEKGLMDNEKRIEILNERLELSDDNDEREYILGILESEKR